MIIALQRAAATPTEMTKQNLYQSIEDLFRIYIEFMAEYYGVRTVDVEPPDAVKQAYMFIGREVPDEITAQFDFSVLKDHPMTLKLDVGASSYYSEIAAMSTLDNLLMNGKITTVQYLERVPDSYVPAKKKLIAEIQKAEMQQSAMPLMPQIQEAAGRNPGVMSGGAAAISSMPDIEVEGGSGYGTLQRKINETGTAEGLV